ncbi:MULTISPECIES: hypothetical protein [Leptolyngbya]|uniref:hypothetical protein n=1 Tax=Leptolyngbya TaxID=47251 RepID=UPI00168909F8|nr:hypothetical protein [Leptolyngbya sp. FACHB-1624]MBD1856005.1 hypothetical protein [Leptolyngbya sp. FACHB-1624]
MQTKTSAIALLLTQADQAHHDYEQSVLKGLYDQDWADWYAEYVIQNGLSELLEQEVTVQQVSQFFTQSYEAYKGKKSGESWADYTAKEMQQRQFV